MSCCAMMPIFFLCLLAMPACFGLQSADRKRLEFTEKVLNVSKIVESNPALKEEWQQNVAAQRDDPVPPEFTCTVETSPVTPTSVHMLRPSDIKVVGAFGDSITAGNGLGAETLPQVAIENRGESWCIGGDKTLEEGVITLPNILKKFNPKLMGWSHCGSTEDNADKSWFNVARPGATNDDLFSEAEMLVERMMADKRVNYTHDWKLLTMFVGGNDLCTSCYGRHSADSYYWWYNRTLSFLYDVMPRVYINVVVMFDVTPVQNMSTGLMCDLLQWGFCECARNWTTLKDMRPLQMAYYEKLKNLTDDPRFNNKDDFTAVLQPHMRDQLPPIDNATGQYDKTVLGPDCFHPNRIAHQGFAIWLWNNMLVPVGKKPFSMDPHDVLIDISCPTEAQPYLFTNQNSDVMNRPVNPEMTSQSVTTTAQPALLIVALMTSLFAALYVI